MRLTTAQLDGLQRIRDQGPGAWCPGTKSRAGGAVSRMFDRMAVAGLCTPPPHTITPVGRKALIVAGRVPTEGWTWLINSRRWHYFRHGHSLCKKFMLLVNGEFEPNGDGTKSPDECSACFRLRTKELMK